MFKDYHDHCDDLRLRLILMKTECGKCFGGLFNSVPTKENEWVEDKDAIIFNLSTN